MSLYDTWRLIDLLLKAGVDGEMDYASVLLQVGALNLLPQR